MVSVTNERCSAREDHEESTNIKGLEDVRRRMRVVKKSDYSEKNDREQNGIQKQIMVLMHRRCTAALDGSGGEANSVLGR